MMLITAEFLGPDGVAPAVSALVESGFNHNQIEVFSLKPVELAPGLLQGRSRISLAAVLGGILGGGLATVFVFFTQRHYPLVTGGMPLISGWSTGVVSYELTMAGAVAGTILAFLWEAGLMRRARGAPAPVLREGSIFLRVKCTEKSAAQAAECLGRAGAVEVAEQQEAR